MQGINLRLNPVHASQERMLRRQPNASDLTFLYIGPAADKGFLLLAHGPPEMSFRPKADGDIARK